MTASPQHIETSCQPDMDEMARRRLPEQVMRLDRMGSFFPTRLSFMRSLIRKLSAERTQITRSHWEMSDEGFGRAVYQLSLGGHDYALIAFTNQLSADQRTDRVIAEAWDAAFVLFDGVPSLADLDRLEAEAPKQEAGRFSAKELVLSRANKSMRLFSHTVDRLAQGQQPDAELLGQIGYLMRTTAVYGNGKFGIADRHVFASRPALQGPFQAEMLTVYLIRHFTFDLVNHIARARHPEAASLSPLMCRHLGIGNSTGLGMAPFLVTHPVLLNNWMLVRETALARVRGQQQASTAQQHRLQELALRAGQHIQQWQVDDKPYTARIETLQAEWQAIQAQMTTSPILSMAYPFDALYQMAEHNSLDCQELMVALLLEVSGDEIDMLADCMDSDIDARLDPRMTIGRVQEIIKTQFSWTQRCQTNSTDGQAHFWYESEEKREPRLGLRYEEEGADKERPLDIARRVEALKADLQAADPHQLVAHFLLALPQHRYIIRRIQTANWAPYGEIQDNLIASTCLPIDMLRCKLSFFGAAKFDPKSDKWTRVTLYSGAPLADELSDDGAAAHNDDWWLPALEAE